MTRDLRSCPACDTTSKRCSCARRNLRGRPKVEVPSGLATWHLWRTQFVKMARGMRRRNGQFRCASSSELHINDEPFEEPLRGRRVLPYARLLARGVEHEC